MARLIADSLADSEAALNAAMLQEKLREQARQDILLDRIGSLIGEGWFARVVRENAARLLRARPHLHARVAADNQARLIRTYHQTRQIVEVHDAAETAEDHGLRPQDLRNKTSGKRKRRRPKVDWTPRALLGIEE